MSRTSPSSARSVAARAADLPPTLAPLRPLVAAEEDWLIAELSAGRKPAVHVLAASVDLAAGARARVVSAAASHDGEYLQVDVRGDRLPFAASELALPPSIAKRVRKAAGVVDPPPRPARRTAKAAASASANGVRAGAVKKTAPAKAAAVQVAPDKAPARSAAPRATKPPVAAPIAGAASGGKAPRRKALAPVSVTISFDGKAKWSVEARSGGRRVRPVEISAAAAAAAAAALEAPEVLAAVTAVTDAMRRGAEQRAADLRGQLAAAEAELAQFSRRAHK